MEREQYPRIYLGMSSLGDPCLRKIFLQWRFARLPKFSSRMLRLFDRGHLEEFRFVHYLRAAGHKVIEKDPKTGRQWEYIEQSGHVKGHSDGIVVIDGIRILTEMKTHSNKSFMPVRRTNDLQLSKHEHFCQMQKYMSCEGLDYGLYMAVNKDNDALHMELIEKDQPTVDWINERTAELLTVEIPPEGISQDPNFWRCSMCDFHGICFDGDSSLTGCRMCEHVEMVEEGGWWCQKTKKGTRLRLNEQLTGCRKHRSILKQ